MLNYGSDLEIIKTALLNYGIDIVLSNGEKPVEADKPYLIQNNPNTYNNNNNTNINYYLPANIKDAYIVMYDLNGKLVTQHTLPGKPGKGHLKLGLMKNDCQQH